MAGGVAQRTKKLLIAVARAVQGDGDLPDEIIDLHLCERFGWTLEELDGQDEARILPALRAENVRRAMARTASAIYAQRIPDAEDLEIWAEIDRLVKDNGGY